MLFPLNITDILLLAFPFLLLRLHLPVNLRAAYEELDPLRTSPMGQDLAGSSTSPPAPEPPAPEKARRPAGKCISYARHVVAGALIMGSFGGAAVLTRNVVGASTLDPDCDLIGDMCVAPVFAKDFNATLDDPLLEMVQGWVCTHLEAGPHPPISCISCACARPCTSVRFLAPPRRFHAPPCTSNGSPSPY